MGKGKTFTMAVVQMDSGANREENLRTAEAAIDEAAAHGADAVCFPEHMDYIPAGMPDAACVGPIPGALTERLGRKAREHGVAVNIGSTYERVPGDERPANTSAVIDAGGRLLATYRKLHLFDVDLVDGTRSRESEEVAPGQGIVAVQTELGVWGLAVCFDLRFPELFRLLALRGAQVLFLPANFTATTGAAHWEPLVRARAIENGCFVVAANQCGEKPGFRAYGHSMVVDPWGRVLAQAGDAPGIVYAKIDLDAPARARDALPTLSNRRPDVYTLEAR